VRVSIKLIVALSLRNHNVTLVWTPYHKWYAGLYFDRESAEAQKFTRGYESSSSRPKVRPINGVAGGLTAHTTFVLALLIVIIELVVGLLRKTPRYV